MFSALPELYSIPVLRPMSTRFYAESKGPFVFGMFFYRIYLLNQSVVRFFKGCIVCENVPVAWGGGMCNNVYILMGHTNLWHDVRMFKARNSFLSSFGRLLRVVCPALFYDFCLKKIKFVLELK